jgi:hypothetical protein
MPELRYSKDGRLELRVNENCQQMSGRYTQESSSPASCPVPCAEKATVRGRRFPDEHAIYRYWVT